MDGLLQKGIEAYKAGKRDEARKIFITVVKQSPDNERTWECLYGVASNDQERIQCLKQILRINPKNEKANQLLNQLTKEQPKAQSTRPVNSNQTSIDNQQKLVDIKQKIPPVKNASQERRTWVERFEEMLYKASLTALNRCFTLFITFGIALGIVPILLGLVVGISGIATNGISSLMLIYYIPVIFMLSSPISIPMFPGGLIAVSTQMYNDSAFETIPLMVGWVIYGVIFLLGFLVKNRYAFIFIYLIFVMLLIMNISGCASTAPEFFSRIN